MYLNITNSETGNNKGSSGTLVHYLEKENRIDQQQEPEYWFNQNKQNVQAYEVRSSIDNNVAKLCKDEAKFFLLNISPSQKEIKFLKEQFGEEGAKEKLKQYAIHIIDEYAKNFKRPGIESSKDLLWYAKVENHHYYSHKDPEVKQGIHKRGERKEGEQMHIQVIVSRKDMTNKIKLSPMNNSRGKNAKHSQKVGQFDRSAFKASGERIFDQQFGFDRQLTETFRYANTQKKGSLQERMEMHKEKEQQDKSRKQKIVQQVQKQTHLKSDKYQKTYLKQPMKTNYLSKPLQQTSDQGYVPVEFLKKKKRKKKNLGLGL